MSAICLPSPQLSTVRRQTAPSPSLLRPLYRFAPTGASVGHALARDCDETGSFPRGRGPRFTLVSSANETATQSSYACRPRATAGGVTRAARLSVSPCVGLTPHAHVEFRRRDPQGGNSAMPHKSKYLRQTPTSTTPTTTNAGIQFLDLQIKGSKNVWTKTPSPLRLH